MAKDKTPVYPQEATNAYNRALSRLKTGKPNLDLCNEIHLNSVSYLNSDEVPKFEAWVQTLVLSPKTAMAVAEARITWAHFSYNPQEPVDRRFTGLCLRLYKVEIENFFEGVVYAREVAFKFAVADLVSAFAQYEKDVLTYTQKD